MFLILLILFGVNVVKSDDNYFYVSPSGSGDTCSETSKCNIDAALKQVNEFDYSGDVVWLLLDEGRHNVNTESDVGVLAAEFRITGAGWNKTSIWYRYSEKLFRIMSSDMLISFAHVEFEFLNEPLLTFGESNDDSKEGTNEISGYSLSFQWVSFYGAYSYLLDPRSEFHFKEITFENSFFKYNREELLFLKNEDPLKITISHCEFVGNEQLVLYISGKESMDVVIADSVFRENHSTDDNRMITILTESLNPFVDRNLSISNCQFIRNDYLLSTLSIQGQYFVLDNSSFSDNTNKIATIDTWNSSLSIRNSLFVQNKGPAIMSEVLSPSNAKFECVSSIFQNNQNSEGQGGAVYCGNVYFSSKNCSFSHNSAHMGGSLYLSNRTKEIIFDYESSIKSSSATYGGAVFLDENPFVELHGAITDNYAEIGGGGIYVNNPELLRTFISSYIGGNHAGNGNDVLSFPVGIENVTDAPGVNCCSFTGSNSSYNYSCSFHLHFVDFFHQVVTTRTLRQFRVVAEIGENQTRLVDVVTYDTSQLFKFHLLGTEKLNETTPYVVVKVTFGPSDATFRNSTQIWLGVCSKNPEPASIWWIVLLFVGVFGMIAVLLSMVGCCCLCSRNKSVTTNLTLFDDDGGVSIGSYISIQGSQDIDDVDENIEVEKELDGNTGMYFVGKRNGKGKIIKKRTVLFGKKKELVLFEGSFKDFTKEGEGKEFDSKGRLRFEGTFVSGRKEGKGKEYFSNGYKKFQGTFTMGKKDGMGVVYDEKTGKRSYQGKWMNDRFTKMDVEDFPILLVDFEKVVQKNEGRMVMIGEGFYSEVWRVNFEGQAMAMKLIRQHLLSDPRKRAEMIKKMRYSSKLFSFFNHIGILKIHAACLKGKFIGCLCDLCVGTVAQLIEPPLSRKKGSKQKSLNKVIQKPVLTYKKKVNILNQTCEAMRYLHSKSLMHRDLKWANVLIDKFDCVKVADFDFAKLDETDFRQSASGGQTFGVGSPFECSPEVLSWASYGKSTDVYSFGIMIHQLLFERINWVGLGILKGRNEKCPSCGVDYNMNTMATHIIRCDLRPRIPRKHSYKSWILDLMKTCWKRDPEDRYSFRQIADIIKKNYLLGSDQMKQSDN